MSGIMSKIEGVAGMVTQKGMALLDSVFPPERRSQLLAKLQQFAVRNPKLSAFLLTNIALTGPPMFLFILFTLTVFIFSLVVALLVGLLVAIGFVLFAVVVALLILFPTVFFTTLAACFLFLWGMGGYYILKWLNKGEVPAPEGKAIGDKLNSLTGGRLDFIMGPARTEYPDHHKKDSGDDKKETNGKAKSPAKTTGADMGKHADTLKKNANPNKLKQNASVDGVTKNTGIDGATKGTPVDGVKGKADTATGTAKGVAGGATGGLL